METQRDDAPRVEVCARGSGSKRNASAVYVSTTPPRLVCADVANEPASSMPRRSETMVQGPVSRTTVMVSVPSSCRLPGAAHTPMLW